MTATRTVAEKLKELFTEENLQALRKPIIDINPKATAEEKTDWLALCQFDRAYSFAQLKKISRLLNKSDSEKLIAKIANFLHTRWNVIRNTERAYQCLHQDALNQFCMKLAKFIAPALKLSPFEVLMPTLKITNYDIVGDTLEDMDYDKIWKYVLSRKDDALINVAECLEFSQKDLQFRHLYIDDTSKNTAFLSKNEATRVAYHSYQATDLFDLIKQLFKAKHYSSTVGSALERLSFFLEFGGVNGQLNGGEFDADRDTFIAISEFEEFLETLDDEQKEILFATQTSSRSPQTHPRYVDDVDQNHEPILREHRIPTTYQDELVFGDIWERLQRQHYHEMAQKRREQKLLEQSSSSSSKKHAKLTKQLEEFDFDNEHTSVRYCGHVASKEINTIRSDPANKHLDEMIPRKSPREQINILHDISSLENKLKVSLAAFKKALESNDYIVHTSYFRHASHARLGRNIIGILSDPDIFLSDKIPFIKEINSVKKLELLLGKQPPEKLRKFWPELFTALADNPEYIAPNIKKLKLLVAYLNANKFSGFLENINLDYLRKFCKTYLQTLYVVSILPFNRRWKFIKPNIKLLCNKVTRLQTLSSLLPNYYMEILDVININKIFDLKNRSFEEALNAIKLFDTKLLLYKNLFFKICGAYSKLNESSITDLASLKDALQQIPKSHHMNLLSFYDINNFIIFEPLFGSDTMASSMTLKRIDDIKKINIDVYKALFIKIHDRYQILLATNPPPMRVSKFGLFKPKPAREVKVATILKCMTRGIEINKNQLKKYAHDLETGVIGELYSRWRAI